MNGLNFSRMIIPEKLTHVHKTCGKSSKSVSNIHNTLSVYIYIRSFEIGFNYQSSIVPSLWIGKYGLIIHRILPGFRTLLIAAHTD